MAVLLATRLSLKCLIPILLLIEFRLIERIGWSELTAPILENISMFTLGELLMWISIGISV